MVLCNLLFLIYVNFDTGDDCPFIVLWDDFEEISRLIFFVIIPSLLSNRVVWCTWNWNAHYLLLLTTDIWSINYILEGLYFIYILFNLESRRLVDKCAKVLFFLPCETLLPSTSKTDQWLYCRTGLTSSAYLLSSDKEKGKVSFPSSPSLLWTLGIYTSQRLQI